MLLCLLSDCSPRCLLRSALTSFVAVVLLFATLGHKASIGKREKKGFFFLPFFGFCLQRLQSDIRIAFRREKEVPSTFKVEKKKKSKIFFGFLHFFNVANYARPTYRNVGVLTILSLGNSSLDSLRYQKSQCPDKNKTVACALRKSGCHVSRRSCYIGDQFYCATSWLGCLVQ